MPQMFQYKHFGDFITQTDAISHIKFPYRLGNLETASIIINENIFIHINNFSIKKDVIFEYDFALDGIAIDIVLDGTFKYKSEVSQLTVIQEQNRTVVATSGKEKGSVYHAKGSLVKSLIIFIKLDFLKEILGDNENIQEIVEYLKNNTSSKLLKSEQTDIKTRLCAYEIYNSSSKTKLDIIYIQSKVLEILSYEFKDIFKNKKRINSSVKFSSYDIAALHLAKKILTKDLQNPPNLSQLSKQVRLNEFKLKVGFKEFFNISPYNFLLDYKLHEAKKLLTSGELNVSEIAQKIGYKQVSSFSNAFYKKFGERPMAFMKIREA